MHEKDLNESVDTHYQSHGHDHFQMAVRIRFILAADFGEQVGTTPKNKRDNRKPEPHK